MRDNGSCEEIKAGTFVLVDIDPSRVRVDDDDDKEEEEEEEERKEGDVDGATTARIPPFFDRLLFELGDSFNTNDLLSFCKLASSSSLLPPLILLILNGDCPPLGINVFTLL